MSDSRAASTAPTINLNFVRELTPEVEALIDDMFEYHPWDGEKQERGRQVRDALAEAVKTLIICVPPGPDRTVAIRKIREARMDADSGITHGGRY